MATTDDKKIIFSMVGVSKTIQQNQKQVLKNIYLSFFYGAKIGIVGMNGAGKSTLMKIIAGIEQQYQGNVVWSPGYSVGYLEQDPKLDDDKTVIEVVKEGVQHIVDALQEYEEINQKFGLPEYYEDEDKMNQLFAGRGQDEPALRSAGRVAGHHRQHRRLEPRQQAGTGYGCPSLSACQPADSRAERR